MHQVKAVDTTWRPLWVGLRSLETKPHLVRQLLAEWRVEEGAREQGPAGAVLTIIVAVLAVLLVVVLF
jgi:hypothetical protein